MTFDATVNPVVYEGGVPVFIDTEYDTWNIVLASTFSQIKVEYIMKKFIQIGDVMFDPNLVQSVRRRYATCCIVEFENGAWLLVEESFKNVCEAIRKAVE